MAAEARTLRHIFHSRRGRRGAMSNVCAQCDTLTSRSRKGEHDEVTRLSARNRGRPLVGRLYLREGTACDDGKLAY
jgi:hypothetical protein